MIRTNDIPHWYRGGFEECSKRLFGMDFKWFWRNEHFTTEIVSPLQGQGVSRIPDMSRHRYLMSCQLLNILNTECSFCSFSTSHIQSLTKSVDMATIGGGLVKSFDLFNSCHFLLQSSILLLCKGGWQTTFIHSTVTIWQEWNTVNKQWFNM